MRERKKERGREGGDGVCFARFKTFGDAAMFV